MTKLFKGQMDKVLFLDLQDIKYRQREATPHKPFHSRSLQLRVMVAVIRGKPSYFEILVVGGHGIEPCTSSLSVKRSTNELAAQNFF